MQPKRITILGSTGSIGRATLEVVAAMPDRFRVVGLSAGRNWQLLAQQAEQFGPEATALADPDAAQEIKSMLPRRCKLLAGQRAASKLIEAVPADVVVTAIVGAVGLEATLLAIGRAKRVAIANKEPLVVAGSIIRAEAERCGTEILPIDSEHSALFQAMQAGRRDEVVRVYLTASGGPFRRWTAEQMATATVEQALAHPTWQMGQKITVDSATMMNKALEIVEACSLFDLQPDQVKVLVHPESIVHSIVQFCDGSFVAQMGSPDMRLPIRYALTYPERLEGPGRILDVTELRALNFEPPDLERFPAIGLGYEVARIGGTTGAVLNAANEVAVEAFLAGTIPFKRIVPLVWQTIRAHTVEAADSLERLLAADRWARAEAASLLQRASWSNLTT